MQKWKIRSETLNGLLSGKVIGIYYKQSFNENFSYCVIRCDKRDCGLVYQT